METRHYHGDVTTETLPWRCYYGDATIEMLNGNVAMKILPWRQYHGNVYDCYIKTVISILNSHHYTTDRDILYSVAQEREIEGMLC